MVGILVFPAKPGKGYEYKKNPKEVFNLNDEDALYFSRGNHETCEVFHYKNDLDTLPDKEIIERLGKQLTMNDISEPKKSGNGYVSGNKEYLIRVLKCDREWFKMKRQ